MNGTDIVTMVCNKTGLTRKQASAAIKATFDSIGLSLACGEEVAITNFGKFYVQERGPRQMPHPRTGEMMDRPPVRTVGFRPAPATRERLND